MASRRNMLERLRAAEHSMSTERMPRAASRRVAKRISRELEKSARPSRMGWIPMFTFVAGAALVLLFLRWSTEESPPTERGDVEPPAMTVHVTGPACRSESGQTTEIWGACGVSTSGPSMRIDTIETSHLEVDGRVVHLRAGSALFDVDKVRGEPVRVAIPQGQIVVVGTRFRVIVAEGHSEVELYEGQLEFHDRAGRVTPIAAGQHVAFGQPALSANVTPATPTAAPTKPEESPPVPAPARRQPKKKAPVTKTEPMEQDAGPVIEAAERLQREGRYADAAAVYRAALKRRWPTRTAEVLSYELGRLLERRMKDRVAACKHWRGHLERFAKTRYRSRIERSMADLACE